MFPEVLATGSRSDGTSSSYLRATGRGSRRIVCADIMTKPIGETERRGERLGNFREIRKRSRFRRVEGTSLRKG